MSSRQAASIWPAPAVGATPRRAYRSSLGGSGSRGTRSDRGSGLALEDRSGDVGPVDDEGEHGSIAPPAEEQVAKDVHIGVSQGSREGGHPARPVVDLGE